MMGALAAARRMHVIKRACLACKTPGVGEPHDVPGPLRLLCASCSLSGPTQSGLFLERRACGSSLSRALAAS